MGSTKVSPDSVSREIFQCAKRTPNHEPHVSLPCAPKIKPQYTVTPESSSIDANEDSDILGLGYTDMSLIEVWLYMSPV